MGCDFSKLLYDDGSDNDSCPSILIPPLLSKQIQCSISLSQKQQE